MTDWLDDINPSRAKRQRGRPEVNPFPSDEVEKDFVMRGRKMLELYYDYSNPNIKNNLVFDERRRMSKTLFWSILFIYYIDKKGLMDNLQGFATTVTKHFGLEVSCDRTTLSKCISMLKNIYVTHKHSDEERMRPSEQKACKKYRGRYQFVVKLWEDVI